jgi:hypothetical protein
MSRQALLRRIEALEQAPSFQRPIVITGGLPDDVSARIWAEYYKSKADAAQAQGPTTQDPAS